MADLLNAISQYDKSHPATGYYNSGIPPLELAPIGLSLRQLDSPQQKTESAKNNSATELHGI